MSSETLMPVDDARVLKEAEILVLRSLQDAMKGIREDIGSIREQVQEVRERMIVIEQRDTQARVTQLEARVSTLEGDKIRLQGAGAVAGWLMRNWQAALILALGVYMLWRSGAALLPHVP